MVEKSEEDGCGVTELDMRQTERKEQWRKINCWARVVYIHLARRVMMSRVAHEVRRQARATNRAVMCKGFAITNYVADKNVCWITRLKYCLDQIANTM
jgi:hypothetical protein